MKSNLIPVKDNPTMARDQNSGAIVYINNNENTRELKRKQRESAQQQKQMLNDIEDLKSEIGEIKSLLNILIEKRN